MDDEAGFTRLLSELDDDTVRQMLIHVSASNADATALVLAAIQRREEGAGKGAGPAAEVEAGPAVAGPPPGRLWRSFSNEELISKSCLAAMETGEFSFGSTQSNPAVAMAKVATLKRTPMTPPAGQSLGDGPAYPEDSASRPRSKSADGALDSTSPSSRRESGGKWWWFGGKRSKDPARRSAKGKRRSGEGKSAA